MSNRTLSRTSVLLLALGLAGTASAELLQGRTEAGHAFVAGGIGDAEQQALKQMAGDYSLQLVMADQGGAYVADNAVRILDRRGDVVLEGVVDAPWLLVDLPAGRYTVEARYEGSEIRRQVDVPASGSRRIYLHFRP